MKKANSGGKLAIFFLLGLFIAGCSQIIDSTTPIDDIFSQGTSQSGSLYVVNGSAHTDITGIIITPQSSGPRSISQTVKPGKPWQSSIRRGEYTIKVGNPAGDWSLEKTVSVQTGKVVELRYNWDIVDGGSWEETESDGGTLRIINRSGEDISEVYVTKLEPVAAAEEKLYLMQDIMSGTSRAFVLEKASYNVRFVKLGGSPISVDGEIDLGKGGVKKDVTILVEPNGKCTIIDNGTITDPSSPTLTPGDRGYFWVFNGRSDKSIDSVKILAKIGDAYPTTDLDLVSDMLAPNKIAPKSAKVWTDVAPGTYKVFVRYEGEDYQEIVGIDKDGVIVGTDDGIYVVDPNDIWGSDTNGKNPGAGDTMVVGYGMLQVINNTQKIDGGGITDPGIAIASVSIKAVGGTAERLTDSNISAGSFRNFYLREGNWDVQFLFADGTPSKTISVTITGEKYVRITVNGKEDIEEPLPVNYGDDNISLKIKNKAEVDTLKITNVRIVDENNRIKMEIDDPALAILMDEEYLWPGRLQSGIYRVMVEVNNKGYAGSRNITLKINDRKTLEFFLGDRVPGDLDTDGLNKSISKAENLLANTPASTVNGADIPPSQNWVPKDVWDNLKDALNDANQALGSTIQEDIDNAQANLDARIEEFENAKKPGTQQTYKGDLLAAIINAKAVRSPVVVSSDGNNVVPSVQWVTQAVWDSLANAIGRAEAVAQKGNATQAEVDKERTDLINAVKTFTDAKKAGTYVPPAPPPVVNKSGLNGKIIEAENLKTGVVIDTDAANVPSGTYWVTQGAMNALNSAITAAQQVATDPNATQNQVDNATIALQTAINTFINERKLGTKGNTPVINLSQLEIALATAGVAKNNVVISADGKDVMPTNYWVTQSIMNTFTGAISTAEGVRANPGSQAAVNSAVSALNTAINTFNLAKASGTYEPATGVDKSALIGAINAAEQAQAGVVTGDGSTLPNGSVYVTSGEWSTFANAIGTAKNVRDNSSATQIQVDSAVPVLTNATTTFNAAKKIVVVDRSELNKAIGLAEGARDGIKQSPSNGLDISKNEKWVTTGDWQTFDSAITTAKSVWSNNAASQKQVNDAKAILDAARTTFVGKIKAGLKDDTSTKLTVKNIDYTKDEMLYLNLYPVNGGATLELVKKGTTSVVPYQGSRSFDNIPEGSYRLRYRCSGSGTILYPDTAGIVIRLKGGYETYLELPGNGEVPRAEIKRIDGGSIAGSGTFVFYNKYDKVAAAWLFPGKQDRYFSSELSGGLRLGSDLPNEGVGGYGWLTEISKNMTKQLDNIDSGVYWFRFKNGSMYGYDSSRWLPIFVFPGETITATHDSGGVKSVEYKK